jgi:cobalamin biosynthesis protein CobT
MEFGPENAYGLAANLTQEKAILSSFSPEQQEEIIKKKAKISSIAKFIGKDFDMPIELNTPGQGWHWNFKENVIRVDPKDLLEKPIEYLRFVIAHEGGHRRISRTAFIPEKQLHEPGFMPLMNAIEDPRMNNFVAEAYPAFSEDMNFAYLHMELEKEIQKEAQKQGTAAPRYAHAVCEYITQWFREFQGQAFELSADLPEDVKEVINNTIEKAQQSWHYYPSKEEADSNDASITAYAKKSYEINRKFIWPEFKKLVEKDIQDHEVEQMIKNFESKKSSQQESLPQGLSSFKEDLEQNNIEPDEDIESKETPLNDNEEYAIPRELKEKLSAEEQEELLQYIEDLKEAAASEEKNAPVVDDLSENLKEKLQEHFQELSQKEQEEIRKLIQEILKGFEEMLNEKLADQFEKMTTEKEEVALQEDQASEDYWDDDDYYDYDHERYEGESEPYGYQAFETVTLSEGESKMNQFTYKEQRKEVLPLIDKLENDLREIFVKRRHENWEGGFRSGKRIDIKHRIQEKAKGTSIMESKSWERRSAPHEQDYAISLLVDLSGSMGGEKIEETFKGVIVLAEVLNKLSIKTEILGFNDHIYLFQEFQEEFSDKQRAKLAEALTAVTDSDHAGNNDDGWAVSEASQRLGHQRENQKFLIVLSDGEPAESGWHGGEEYDLNHVVKQISQNTDQKIIGLGIGKGTQHVETYYPNSIANVSVHEMSSKLTDLLREVIENYDQF